MFAAGGMSSWKSTHDTHQKRDKKSKKRDVTKSSQELLATEFTASHRVRVPSPSSVILHVIGNHNISSHVAGCQTTEYSRFGELREKLHIFKLERKKQLINEVAQAVKVKRLHIKYRTILCYAGLTLLHLLKFYNGKVLAIQFKSCSITPMLSDPV